jgi:hypothetical protein
MYCSGCGLALAPGQPVCPQCGRPAAVPAPPVPGMAYLVATYASKVKTLGVFWIVYAGINLLFGLAGMAFLRAWMSHWGGTNHGPWDGGFPFSPWFGPAILHFGFTIVWLRTGLALAAGWGLIERTQWGRFVALVAAFLSILKFPFGTALAIFTLVLLLGYRNNTLYNELQRAPVVF